MLLIYAKKKSAEAAIGIRVLWCVAVCCSVFYFQRIFHTKRAEDAIGIRVLQCVAVCCSVLQCVAVCCSVLQCVAVCSTLSTYSKQKKYEAAIGIRHVTHE